MSQLVLYRKYRPQKFSEVISQEHVKTTLSNAVMNDRVGHAYLFTGPRGVGKTTMARILSRAVNCPNVQNGEPCNTCDLCLEFLGNNNLDFMEIDAASHTGVDNIRELIEHLQFSPSRAKYKVIIIDEVHMLSKGAFNALLKTLEEPPKHAIFILATTEVHKLPATIISRTQRFDFKKVNMQDMVKLLRYVCDDNKVKINDEALNEIAAAADGGFRDGLSLLDQVLSYSTGEIDVSLVEEVLGLTGVKTIIEFLDLIAANNTPGAVKFISDLMYSGRDLFQFQKDLMEYLRKLLLAKVANQTQFDYAQDVNAMIANQAQNFELPKLLKVIEAFQLAGMELKNSPIPSLPLELAVVKAVTVPVTTPAPVPVQQPATVETPVVPTIVLGNDPEALARIMSNWNQILDKVKEYNHSLISTLKLAQPVAVAESEFVIIVPYKFHKDTIEARKNRIIIDQVLDEVLGIKLVTKPILAKEWTGEIPQSSEPEQPTEQSLVESALKIMGGEVES